MKFAILLECSKNWMRDWNGNAVIFRTREDAENYIKEHDIKGTVQKVY